ncbi:Glycine cleavage system H protein [bacterium HR40]|nr:Glycine cleavage system H protein [bacterium HR40]
MTVRYTEEHEWILAEGTTGTVGITHHAQQQLGDIVYVELPEVGRRVAKGEAVAVVESVKAASEVYAPASGRVIAVNGELAEHPELVNRDPEGAGWFFRLELADPSELEGLMDADAYRAFLATLA